MRLKLFPVFCLLVGLSLGAVWGCAQADSNSVISESDRTQMAERAENIRSTLVENGEGGGEGGSGASAAKPTGWAALKGTIKVVGTPPQNPILNVDKHRSVCAPGGREVRGEQVVVGPDNGLANVIVYVRKIPESWVHESAKEAPSEPFVYDQKDCTFLSHVVAVHTDRDIVIKNSDSVPHNTDIRGVDNLTVSELSSIPYSFGGKAKSSPLTVACSIHPWMRSYILPLDHGYFFVTGSDGKFEIKDLPAGVPLEFQIWQEQTGGLSGGEISNPNVKWGKRGRFTVTLKPDTEEVLDINVPAAVFN